MAIKTARDSRDRFEGIKNFFFLNTRTMKWVYVSKSLPTTLSEKIIGYLIGWLPLYNCSLQQSTEIKLIFFLILSYFSSLYPIFFLTLFLTLLRTGGAIRARTTPKAQMVPGWYLTRKRQYGT